MNKVRRYSTFLIAFTMVVVTACSATKEAAQPATPTDSTLKDDPMAKYKEPVTLNIGYYTNPDNKWPAGSNDSFNDNRYTRMFEDKLNIKFKHTFEVPLTGYDQKVNLLISSNDIPNVMRVSEAQFKIMAESDMLEDLTTVYKNYGSPLLKEVIGDFGPDFIKRVTRDGKLLGIPSTTPAHNDDGVVWVRKDWLKKVGIDLPFKITMDDVEKVAKAFVDQDPDGNGKNDTIGIQSTSKFVTPTMYYNSMDVFFTAFKAFPQNWVKDASGKIVYGSTTQETKQALGKLRDLYAKGLIDKEFGTIKDSDYAKLNSAGRAGISTGYTWATTYTMLDSIKNDPKADWDAHMLVAADGKYYARQANPLAPIMVVKKGTPHPEALVKAINVMTEFDNNVDPKVQALYADSPGTNWNIRPIQANFRKKYTARDRTQRFFDVAAGKMKKEELTPADVKIFEDYSKGLETLRTSSPADWAYVAYIYLGGKVWLDPANVEVYNAYYGITKTMETKWTNLIKLENEAFIRIITGDKPLDYFETFVSEWKKQGGDEIIKEVEGEVKKSGA